MPSAVVNLGLAPENTVAETLARTLSLPLVEADEWPTEAVGDASTRWMEQVRLLPLRLEDDHVVVASADPTDTAALHAAIPPVRPAGAGPGRDPVRYPQGRRQAP